jgi:membrane protease YdiL (CAAX protease family)
MKFLRDSTPFTQVLFTLITIILGGIFISLTGFLFCRIFFGIGFEELTAMLSDFEEPRNLMFMKMFQILQTFGMFIVPPLVIVWSLDDKPMTYLKLDTKPGGFLLFMVCMIILTGGPVIEWFSVVNQHLVLPGWMSSIETWMRNSEDQANNLTVAFLSASGIGGLVSNLFMVAVLPAIGEELLFRGLLQRLIKRMTGSSHWGIWITAALFSALHLQFFGFLPRLLLGALFGYLLEWTGTLWLPMIAHFINNATGVLVYFFTGEGLERNQTEMPVFNNSLFFWALASGAVLWFLLRYLYLKRVQEEIRE